MAEINLLPRRLRQGQSTKRWLSAGLVAGVLLLVLIAGLWYLARAAVTDEKAYVDTTQQAKIIKQDQSAELTGGTTSAEDLDTANRASTLNTLSVSEVDWPLALNLVGQILPTSTTISSYTYATGTVGVTLTMSGTTDSIADFAGFIQTLQDDARFTNVAVSSYTYQPKDGSVGFSLTLTLASKSIFYPSISAK